MKLLINSFLPIDQESKIDLSKKLLVFVGENNAGKTYISKIIWSIFNIDNLILHRGDIDFFNNKEIQTTQLDVLEVKDKIEEIYNKQLNKFLKKVFGNKQFNIKVIFEEEDYFKFKKFAVGATFGDLIHRITINKSKNSSMLNFKVEKIDIKTMGIKEELELKDYPKTINNFLYFFIIKILLNQNCVYLPESRLIMPKFYKYLLVSQKQKIKELAYLSDEFLDKKELPFDSDIVEDAIIDKLVLEMEKEKENEYIHKLENIIEGKIKVLKNEDFGLSYFVYHNRNVELPLEKSSSMVNQLTLLYLYFKYWYKNKRKNFLIIDEPEMNLHPKKKVKLMEFLIDFASKNKLLITTHSHIMAKTIINYIELLDLKNKNKDKYKKILKEFDLIDINLKSEEIGIYYFNGNAIIPYKDDDRSNIHFGTFSEVEKELKDIYWRIDDYKENDDL